ncbi:MAG: NAD(P)H-dependent glycerol-3-phosphate dehydrogenase [Mycoplasmatales bacterium]|nr:NAD(P)H-dependent glycerol-3-phosphate dehydrogenase [Mycoplasmatales bacterium]
MKNKITVIGSGAMGTAVSKVIYDSQNKDITIYGVDKKEMEDLKEGKNTKYFPESVKLPRFNVDYNISSALKDAKYIILAVPSKFMDIVLENVVNNINSEVILINVAKGFFPKTKISLHAGIKEKTKDNKLIKGVVSLIGPSHAEEIVLGMPTAVSVVDTDKKILLEVQKLFNNDYFRTYIQTEVKGAEVGAAYKNVLAIASGISFGLGYGINTRAALLTRGIAEMLRFNEIMGGESKTIMGLTGIGDLIVTATSKLSRNYNYGISLAKKGVAEKDPNITVEGIYALKVINDISLEKKIDLPIVNCLHEIIFENKDVNSAIELLWKRKPFSE